MSGDHQTYLEHVLPVWSPSVKIKEIKPSCKFVTYIVQALLKTEQNKGKMLSLRQNNSQKHIFRLIGMSMWYSAWLWQALAPLESLCRPLALD